MTKASVTATPQDNDWLCNMVDATYEWLEERKFPPFIAMAYYPTRITGTIVRQSFVSASQITKFDTKSGVKFYGLNSSAIVMLDGSRTLNHYINDGALDTGEHINALLAIYLKKQFGDAVVSPEALKTAETSLLGRIFDRGSYTIGLFKECLPKNEMKHATQRPCLIAFQGPSQQ